MAKTSTAANVIAKRYATALIETADQAKVLDSVEKDLAKLAVMLEQSADLVTLISSPVFSREQQQSAIGTLGKESGFDRLTMNFLGVLSQNRRLYSVGAIIKAFRAELSKRRGEVTATIKAAYPLTPDQETALRNSLTRSVGANVQLDVSIDKSLLGGMIVTVGSRMIDDSVKGKLARLKLAMQSSPNTQSLANQNTPPNSPKKEVV